MTNREQNSAAVFHSVGIVVAGLIFSMPVILYGFPFGHDAAVHLGRYRHFADQLWAGEFYPRWLQGMNGGLGSPVFFFYGPIPYYVASAFRPFIHNDPYGWHQLGLASSLGVVACGLAAYLWLRNVTSPKAAFIAAILYMAMPYPLAVDLYRRAALSEYWTFVWIPLCLYFTRKIADERKPALVGLAVTYALLILTHALIALVFWMISLAYVLLVADKNHRLKALTGTIASLGLGIGLSAVYLLPAIITQDYVAVEELRDYYKNHFLFTSFNLALLKLSFSTLETFLSQMTIVTIGVAFCGFLLAFKNVTKNIRYESWLWLIIVVISTGMMLSVSRPIWRTITVLQTLQMPWRLLVLLSVATAALIALAVFSMEQRSFTRFSGVAAAIASLLIISWVLPTARIVIQRYGDSPMDANLAQFLELGMENSPLRPRWVRGDTFNRTVLELSERPTKARVITGDGSVVIQRWRAREIVLQTNTREGGWVAINQFYYPGWAARLGGESSTLPVRPSNEEGLLNIWVPGGTRIVLLQLGAGFAERVGRAISALSLAVVIGFAFWYRVARFRVIRFGRLSSRDPRNSASLPRRESGKGTN